ncbi:hypothetical protein CDD80_2566 [Ophiocordyceps camponoti-rufipedis]|uniref:Uncharacterized protein n=1 Tax=Ophiocordyceps camponoti-rufipedis TaxID=2004952 RepID=A0A2C5ZE63_9HYPO|nr:hypothetical protein CDD80_2566 [Ophiocordyceps camponoti-rufipedis]
MRQNLRVTLDFHHRTFPVPSHAFFPFLLSHLVQHIEALSKSSHLVSHFIVALALVFTPFTPTLFLHRPGVVASKLSIKEASPGTGRETAFSCIDPLACFLPIVFISPHLAHRHRTPHFIKTTSSA